MSLVTGYLRQITKAPANRVVTITPKALGVVTASAALVLPEVQNVPARATDGFWSATLEKGSYEISAVGRDGLRAKRLITIPEEDDESYLFDELIVDDGPLYEAPVGGARPLASSTVAGLVFLDEDPVLPYAVTGMFYALDIDELRAEVANATNNKVAYVRESEAVYQWEAESTEADDGGEVLRPGDTDAGDPGRWHLVDAANPNNAKALTTVADKAALKATTCSATLGVVGVIAPEPGMSRFYRCVVGDATAADDFTVIEPTDGSGRFIAWL